jgi:hypothetical protein
MKHLWLVATCMLVAMPVYGSTFETKDVSDIEAEDMAAEAEGSQLSQAYLDQKKEQQKIDTRLDESRAQKVIEASKTQQAYSEALINKAETEIAILKKQEAAALARREKAIADKKAAIARFHATVKRLKIYRARVKRAQALAMREEQKVAVVNSRTAKIQGMMPGR